MYSSSPHAPPPPPLYVVLQSNADLRLLIVLQPVSSAFLPLFSLFSFASINICLYKQLHHLILVVLLVGLCDTSGSNSLYLSIYSVILDLFRRISQTLHYAFVAVESEIIQLGISNIMLCVA
jgi:hypothetical protein